MQNFWSVRFWNKYNEVILIGNQCEFDFESEQEAIEFVKTMNVKNCVAVTFSYYETVIHCIEEYEMEVI